MKGDGAENMAGRETLPSACEQEQREEDEDGQEGEMEPSLPVLPLCERSIADNNMSNTEGKIGVSSSQRRQTLVRLLFPSLESIMRTFKCHPSTSSLGRDAALWLFAMTL